MTKRTDDPAAILAEMAAVANGDAPPIADCPFSLTPPVVKTRGRQPGLFSGDRPRCDCCREPFDRSTSDAMDPDAYCSAACERGELG